MQEVKPHKHKQKEKVPPPPAVLPERRFTPAVFVKEESSPPQSSKKTTSPRKKAPHRADPSEVESIRMDSFLACYGTTTKFLASHVQSCYFGDGPRKTRLVAALQLLADPASFGLRQHVSIRAHYTMGKEQGVEHVQRLFPEEDLIDSAQDALCCNSSFCSLLLFGSLQIAVQTHVLTKRSITSLTSVQSLTSLTLDNGPDAFPKNLSSPSLSSVRCAHFTHFIAGIVRDEVDCKHCATAGIEGLAESRA